MKKIGVMLIALLALGFVLTGCGLLNPVKDTVWVRTETSAYYTYKYTLSFAKDTVSMKTEATITSGGVNLTSSDTITGTYEYKSGEVIGTMSYEGESFSFTATVEKDTLTLKESGDGQGSMTFTKQ